MDNLREQMQALAQGIVTSASERMMAVGDGQAHTARTLQAFGRERAAMARVLKSGLVAGRAVRSVDVCTLRANVGAMCEEFRQDHARTRRSLCRRLAQSTEAVASFVASLRADFSKGRADFSNAHRRMTEAHRAGLAKDRRDRSREVAELMNDFHVSRRDMAQELAESLAKSTQEIKSQISGLNGFRASLRKIREDAWVTRQIPSRLFSAQVGGAAPVQFSGLSREPEDDEIEEGREKATIGEAISRFVGEGGRNRREKPKRK